jgi:protein-disulfide isomerase
LLLTAVAIWLVLFGENQMLARARLARSAASTKQGLDQCVGVVNQIRRDTDWLFSNWKKSPGHEIPVRPDDPVRFRKAEASDPLRAVVFSDFQCPSCKQLAEFLTREVEPRFGGHLEVVFKHFPLHSDCNPKTTTRKHEYACAAAAMAEAARILGGNEAFWKAHDFLFDNQDKLRRGRLAPAALADHLGLDSRGLRGAMQSEETRARFRRNAEEGRACGVNGTPVLFVQGRRVHTLARREAGFWDKVAEMYWQDRNEPRPASTRLPSQVPTAENQDQDGAP